MLNYLDAKTEDRLRKHVWYWSLGVVVLIIFATAGIMWLRQGLSFSHGWVFKADEFAAIGTWFSGTAAAAALFSGAALVVNDRRRQWVRDRLAEANEIQYHYRDDPDPTWVVHNGSPHSITLLHADGTTFHRTILPNADLRLRDATMLARVGYRGDQPVDALVFADGEYVWTRKLASIVGERVRPDERVRPVR